MIRLLIVLSILVSSVSFAQEMRARLQNQGYRISNSPKFDTVTEQVKTKIATMTNSLLTAEEKSAKVEVVLLEQPEAEVLVIKEPGKFTVAISDGLLQNLKNDDQLAILVADNLVHPTVTLEKNRQSYGERWMRREETKLEEVFKRVHDGGWSPREYRELGPVLSPYVYKEGSSAAMFRPRIDEQIRKLDIALNHAKFAQGNVIRKDTQNSITKLSQDQWLRTSQYHSERRSHIAKMIDEMDRTRFEKEIDKVLQPGKYEMAYQIWGVVDDRYRTISHELHHSVSKVEETEWRDRVEKKTLADLSETLNLRMKTSLNVEQVEALSKYVNQGKAGSENPENYKKVTDNLDAYKNKNRVSPIEEAVQKAASITTATSEEGIAKIAALPEHERNHAVEKALQLRAENFLEDIRSETDEIMVNIKLSGFFKSDGTLGLLQQHSNPQSMYDILFRKHLPAFEKEFVDDIGRIKTAAWVNEVVANTFKKSVANETPIKISKETAAFLMDSFVGHLEKAFKYETRTSSSDTWLKRLGPPFGAPAEVVKPHQAAFRQILDMVFDLRREEFAKAGFKYSRDHQLADIAVKFRGLADIFPEAKSMKPNDLWKATKEVYLLEKAPISRGSVSLPELLEAVGNGVPRSDIVQTFTVNEFGYSTFGSNAEFVAAAKQLESEIKAIRSKPAFPKTLAELAAKWPWKKEEQPEYRTALQKMLLERFQELQKKYPGDHSTIARKLFEGLKHHKLRDETPTIVKFLARNGIIPKTPRDRLQFYIGSLDIFGSKEFSESLKIETITMNILGEKKGQIDFSKFRSEDLVPVYDRMSTYNRTSAVQDQLYRHLKNASKTNPTLGFKPKINTILDDGLRKEVMLDIMRRELPGFGASTKKEKATSSNVRSDVAKLEEIINSNLASDDPLRRDLVENFEKHYGTTAIESQHLRNSIAFENTLPREYAPGVFISSMTESEDDSYQILRYVLGRDARAFPDIVKTDELKGSGRQLALGQLQDFHLKFHSAGPAERALMLQHLLGGKHGLLANPQTRERVERLLLGQYADNKVVSKMFRSYLANQSIEDREITYGRFLSSLADKNGKGELQIGTILDSMYAFGDRAKQGLAVSPLMTNELRNSLSESFSNSHPPTRQEIYKYLTNIFGKTATDMTSPELIGSGSVNFVLKVKMKDPVTGDEKPVVLRIQKDGVEGQVANQDEIWKKVTQDLLRDLDPEVRRAGTYIEEVREYATHSLKAGGADLNQAQERAMYTRAKTVYEGATPSAATGFKTEVTKPLDHFQKRYVPPQFSEKVSIYEYVPNVPLSSLPERQRAVLAEQMVALETKAVVMGEFDSEPHPGNWLVDTESKRLVRTDYASFTKITAEEAAAVRDVLGSLLQAKPSSKDIEKLAKTMPLLFRDRETAARLVKKALETSFAAKDFPPFHAPSDRLIYIRKILDDEYEKVLTKQGKTFSPLKFSFNVQSAFSNLQKTAQFRDFMTPTQIAATYMSNLGVSKTKMATGLLRSVGDACIKSFGTLGRKSH